MKASSAVIPESTIPETKINPGASPKPTSSRKEKKDLPIPNYRRCYNKEKQRFYYVDLTSGESKWRAPTKGLVLCR